MTVVDYPFTVGTSTYVTKHIPNTMLFKYTMKVSDNVCTHDLIKALAQLKLSVPIGGRGGGACL